MTDALAGGLAVPSGYGELLAEVRVEVLAARVRAARVVNVQLTALYGRIGRLILNRQGEQAWGSGVIDRLAADLRSEFPGMRGFAPRNLAYMRSFAAIWPDDILQQPVAELPWGHITVLIDRLPDRAARDWYAAQDRQHGWSRAVLTHHITADRRGRAGAAANNFTETIPPAESDQATEILQDPYNLDFLALDAGHSERELEDALVARLTHFLAELGAGFAFVGRQYRLPIGNRDYFIDLLFFHLGLRRFVVFELKTTPIEPEHLGKLNFYVNAVDDLLRRPEHDDGPTIGILLAATNDNIVVEYAMRGLSTPMAISTYTTHRDLPDDVRPQLPTPTDLAQAVRGIQSGGNDLA